MAQGMGDPNAPPVPGNTIAGPLNVVTAFGCNGKAAQVALASGGAVVATSSTTTTPWGYATQGQADAIVTLLNNIRLALVANGIMS